MPVNECAYCGERFASTPAYDRHLLIRRMTVTTPKGFVVPNEEVITCRPVEDFAKSFGRSGRPRLVRNSRGRWAIGVMPAEIRSRLRASESPQTGEGTPQEPRK